MWTACHSSPLAEWTVESTSQSSSCSAGPARSADEAGGSSSSSATNVRRSLPSRARPQRAEAGHERVLAGLHPGVLTRVEEGERNGRTRRVPVAVERHDRALHGNAQALRRGLDDPQVGLVGDDETDVVGADVGDLHGLFGGIDDDAHGPTEDFLAIHPEESSVFTREKISGRSVGAQDEGQDVRAFFVVFQYRGTGAVSEQDRRVAVAPVDPAREILRTDHQYSSAARLDRKSTRLNSSHL